jgi:hypothetical protein
LISQSRGLGDVYKRQLREQLDYKYPMGDLDLLADEMGTSEPKVKAVVCNYDLFTLDEQDNFFSIKQLYYLQPYIEKTQRARLAAQKRWDNVSEDANAMQMHSKCNADAMQVKESKVKESKEKETKVKENKVLALPFISENFVKYWGLWKDYKKEEHKFNFKSIESEQASLNELVKLSDGLENDAIRIIEQSLANGWKGFFKLKNDNNGTTKNQSRVSPKITNEQLHEAFIKRSNGW